MLVPGTREKMAIGGPGEHESSSDFPEDKGHSAQLEEKGKGDLKGRSSISQLLG